MKALSISRLCLVCVLIAGLLVAWSSATPQQLTENQLVGGGDGDCCTGRWDVSCAGYNNIDCLYVKDCWFADGTRTCAVDSGDEVCLADSCTHSSYEDECNL